MYLDACRLIQSRVGFGQLGVAGGLGYEGKHVSVAGSTYAHALSTHPPAHLVYDLARRFRSFRCHVAINDDVDPGASSADFVVIADGRQVAAAWNVAAGAQPRLLTADVRGAHFLELVVGTRHWTGCHAVWLDPSLEERVEDGVLSLASNGSLHTTHSAPAHSRSGVVLPVTWLPLDGGSNAAAAAPPDIGPDQFPRGPFLDCLGRTEITPPVVTPRARRCIATVVSPGFEPLLDDLLGSLYAYGGCEDALVAVLVAGDSVETRRVVSKYGATAIACRPYARVNPTLKAALYSIARVVDADQFVCLDADMLVLGDLRPVFAAMEACPEMAILACREGNGRGWHVFNNLVHALTTVYGGSENDLRRLVGTPNGEAGYSLVVNDGLFAGTRAALLALDGAVRAMPQAAAWTDEKANIWWRNQFVFNLALARLESGVELDPVYNVQLNSHDVEFQDTGGRIQATWEGRTARVLHFNGLGRGKNLEWRGRFAEVADPLVRMGGGDGYAEFLAALRAWVGRHGVGRLAWSFYGTADAAGARVDDPSTAPLLALLHYLVRANGCVRVLETGTAFGVSAACLASAVAHRPEGRVVTFDPAFYPEREQLWAALPQAMRACIEPRTGDSVAGMAGALAAGESYDLALLDSLHVEDHVWNEFQLATRLVCPGGLILIHDARLPGATVDRALARIEAAGYGVTRLWTAECGVPADDGLGLAVIENRKWAKGGPGSFERLIL